MVNQNVQLFLRARWRPAWHFPAPTPSPTPDTCIGISAGSPSYARADFQCKRKSRASAQACDHCSENVNKIQEIRKKSLNMQAHQENVRLTKKPLWALIIAAFAKILALELQQVGQKLLTTL
jgi:hypothetical protein